MNGLSHLYKERPARVTGLRYWQRKCVNPDVQPGARCVCKKQQRVTEDDKFTVGCEEYFLIFSVATIYPWEIIDTLKQCVGTGYGLQQSLISR